MSIVIKSKSELAIMREAGRITCGAIWYAGERLKPGMSTLDVDKLVGHVGRHLLVRLGPFRADLDDVSALDPRNRAGTFDPERGMGVVPAVLLGSQYRDSLRPPFADLRDHSRACEVRLVPPADGGREKSRDNHGNVKNGFHCTIFSYLSPWRK